jgi:hypothetical protein
MRDQRLVEDPVDRRAIVVAALAPAPQPNALGYGKSLLSIGLPVGRHPSHPLS